MAQGLSGERGLGQEQDRAQMGRWTAGQGRDSDTDPLHAAGAGDSGESAVVQLEALRAQALGGRIHSAARGWACTRAGGLVDATKTGLQPPAARRTVSALRPRGSSLGGGGQPDTHHGL